MTTTESPASVWTSVFDFEISWCTRYCVVLHILCMLFRPVQYLTRRLESSKACTFIRQASQMWWDYLHTFRISTLGEFFTPQTCTASCLQPLPPLKLQKITTKWYCFQFVFHRSKICTGATNARNCVAWAGERRFRNQSNYARVDV